MIGGDVLALDPGLNNPAAAHFRDGVLLCATRIEVPFEYRRCAVGQRCLSIARLIRDWFVPRRNLLMPLTYVTEYPRVYRASKSKGDPNDLLPLVGVGFALAGMLNCTIQTPTPDEWAGQVPKATSGDPWDSVRGRRIWGRLTDRERAAVVPSHDAIDAVGIGLHACGRFERVRVFPGATST